MHPNLIYMYVLHYFRHVYYMHYCQADLSVRKLNLLYIWANQVKFIIISTHLLIYIYIYLHTYVIIYYA